MLQRFLKNINIYNINNNLKIDETKFPKINEILRPSSVANKIDVEKTTKAKTFLENGKQWNIVSYLYLFNVRLCGYLFGRLCCAGRQ